MLANTTCKGMVVRSGDLRVARFERGAGLGGPTVVLVAWLGSKTGTTQRSTVSLNPTVGGSEGASTATVITLLGNSTNGQQRAVSVSSENAVTITASEMPTFVALGMDPEPPSGPVPPITPPPNPLCAERAIGLSCSNATTSGADGVYIACPDGTPGTCPNGGTCVDNGNGTVHCAENPASACAAKAMGLYCSNASATPAGWPDPYVVCPAVLPRFCPVESPQCTQFGATIRCGLRP